MPDLDAIVIGAGMGGLSTAAFLATNGKRVLVLEQNQVVGGCTQVFRRRGNKYEFDVGVHYIGQCQPGGKVPTMLRGLGLEGRIEFAQLDEDGHSTIVFPEVTFRVPRGWDNYLERLIETFPDEEQGLRRCIGVMRAISAEGDKLTLLRWGLRSLSSLFESCRLSPTAQAVIVAENGDYTCAPSRTPVAMHAGFLHHYLSAGAYYPRGGGQVISAHLVDVIRAHGSTVRTKALVERILVENGRVAGVRLANGEEFRAPVVVSNADIKRTYLEMIGREHLSGRFARRVDGFRMAAPLFSVYLALDIDIRDRLPNSIHWLHRSIDIEGLYRDIYAGRIPAEVPVFLTSGTLKDPDGTHSAPPRHSTLELITIAPPHYSTWQIPGPGPAHGGDYSHDPNYLALKEKLTEAVIETATTILPDLRDHIVFCEASTPITQERFTRSTDGTCYGLEPTWRQLGPFRPSVRGRVPGLFLAGGSTQHMYGIVATLSGGVSTASAVLGRNLHKELDAGAVFGDASLLTAGGEGWDPLVTAKPSSPIRRPLRQRS